MLEKPDIPDELIISRLQQEYDLAVTELTFLPLGVDENTAVYRVLTQTGAAYFLKLRKNFNEIIVRVPLLLQEQGIQAILVPFAARSGQRWADFDDYKILLYPFIAGKDSFGVELSDRHKRIFGAALKSIHTTQIPTELKGLIPKENYSPHWRELLKSFQTQVENNKFTEPTAIELAGFMRSRRDAIRRLLERTESLPTNRAQSHWNSFYATRTFMAPISCSARAASCTSWIGTTPSLHRKSAT
jgi:spectinomycin phosphotransferase